MFKYIVKEIDIPSDLEDYFDNDDIMLYSCGDKFDLAMIERGFFECGIVRRSHRVITDFFKSLTIEEIKNSLLGLNDIGMPIEKVKTKYEELMVENNNSEIDMILNLLREKKDFREKNPDEVIDYQRGLRNSLSELILEIEKLKEDKEIYLKS